jgi:hypothetical protein
MASEGAAVVAEGAAVGAAVAAGASCRVGLSPLATLALVGTVREGDALGGGEFSSGAQARRLDQPTTPEGEAGGRCWGGVTLPALACLEPSTPWKGEGWCWAGRLRSIKPWPHKGGGWGMGEGGELGMTAH